MTLSDEDIQKIFERLSVTNYTRYMLLILLKAHDVTFDKSSGSLMCGKDRLAILCCYNNENSLWLVFTRKFYRHGNIWKVGRYCTTFPSAEKRITVGAHPHFTFEPCDRKRHVSAIIDATGVVVHHLIIMMVR